MTYREKNLEIKDRYLPHTEKDFPDLDKGLESLKADCFIVIGQYLGVLLVISTCMILTKKTNVYMTLLPYLIAFVQLCELPFRPIFPNSYLFITTAWLIASYFFFTVLSFQTLYQAIPILVILLLGHPLRLYILIKVEHIPYGYLAVFAVLALAIAIMISIDVVSSAKLVF